MQILDKVPMPVSAAEVNKALQTYPILIANKTTNYRIMRRITLLLVLLISMAVFNANARFDTSTTIQKGNLFFHLDKSAANAMVAIHPDGTGAYRGDIVIPSSLKRKA